MKSAFFALVAAAGLMFTASDASAQVGVYVGGRGYNRPSVVVGGYPAYGYGYGYGYGYAAPVVRPYPAYGYGYGSYYGSYNPYYGAYNGYYGSTWGGYGYGGRWVNGVWVRW